MKHLITLVTLGLGALLLSACGSTESGVCPITGARGPRPAGMGQAQQAKADCCKSENGKAAACCAKDEKGNLPACCKSKADKKGCCSKSECSKKSACKSEAKAGCCSTKAACDSGKAAKSTGTCPVTGATGEKPAEAAAPAAAAATTSAVPSCCSGASAS